MEYFTLDIFGPLFDILRKCENIEQNPKYHPEGNVLNHSLQCHEVAMRETNDFELIFASTFHDIGKIVVNHGHEDFSSDLCSKYLWPKSLWLIQEHMRIKTFLSGEMNKYSSIQNYLDHPWFKDLVHLNRIDNCARNPNKKIIYDPEKIIKNLNKKIDLRFKANQEKDNNENNGSG